MTTFPLVSIFINNYNYAAFLRDAIDSALRQTYAPIEIVVVDDGSTDASREIIARYGDKIVPVLKRNGGQGSAYNAGVARSRGEVICFLDSDDCFTPDKVAQTVAAFQKQDFRSKPMMVHHPLTIMGDGAGKFAGRLIGRKHESPLNHYDFARRYGFLFYMAGPTSGVSINRVLAERLFPIPEDGVRTSADDFIVRGATLVGELHLLDVALGLYRIHGNNAWFSGSRQKTPAFNDALDAFLNKRLVESGRMPVMRFSKSMSCWADLALERRRLALLGHIARLAVLQHDRLTAWFAYQALRLAIKGQSEAERTNTSLIR
jgi:glycosyltransferase involved in cell wall biosynthesis